MITVLLWKWSQPGFRETYTMQHANTMVQMLHRNIKQEHRIILITDDPAGAQCETFPLWTDHDKLRNASGAHLPSCYRRLKAFDQATLAEMGIKAGSRVCWIDLDAVITGPLDDILDFKGMFVGWAVRGAYHHRVFNGSFVMWTAGTLQNLWDEFDPTNSPARATAAHYFGSDQSWISFNLAKNVTANGFAYPQIASWPREIRAWGRLDHRTRIAFFHGAKKPWHPDVVKISPWIQRYYHMNHKGVVPQAVVSAP